MTNIYFNPITFILCLIIVMSRRHVLILLGHDAVHYLICKNKTLNDSLYFLLVSPTVFPLMFRFRTWTEHWGSDSTHIIKVNAIEKFFLYPCNTWCHKEHHKYPKMPFWTLPQMRSETDSQKATSTRELFQILAKYNQINYKSIEPSSRSDKTEVVQIKLGIKDIDQ
jgi:fatty acid desaturase